MSRVDEDEGWWCALHLLPPGALRRSQETLFRLFYIVGLSLRFPETPGLYLLIEGDPVVDMCSELSSVEWASQEVQLYLLTSRWNESSWTGLGRCRLRRRADEHAVPPKGEAVPVPQTRLYVRPHVMASLTLGIWWQPGASATYIHSIGKTKLIRKVFLEITLNFVSLSHQIFRFLIRWCLLL